MRLKSGAVLMIKVTVLSLSSRAPLEPVMPILNVPVGVGAVATAIVNVFVSPAARATVDGGVVTGLYVVVLPLG